MNGKEYDSIRKFIRYGCKNKSVVSIGVDPRIRKGLNNIPFGPHSIVTYSSINSREIIALVGIFGLFFYKVIVTRNAIVYANDLKFTSINPQTGKEYKHLLMTRINNPAIYTYTQYDNMEPMKAIGELKNDIYDKVKNAFFGSEPIV